MWHDLLRLLSLQDANTRTVLLGTALLGLSSGVIGALAVLRRRALVSDAVAHAALPGVCVAFLIVGERSFVALLLGALVFGMLAGWCISWIRSATRIKEDAATALVIGGFFGLGVMLSGIIQRDPAGNQAGIDGFLFGKAASMVRGDVHAIAIAAASGLLLVVVFLKELRMLCFDPQFGAASGWPISLLDLSLMALVCVVTVVGLPAVGVVLMVALLIIPGAAARFWTDRFGTMLLIAGAIGLASGVIGTVLSAVLPTPASSASRGWPTGPMIVLSAGAAFVISLLFGPRRGLVAAALQRTGYYGSLREPAAEAPR